LLSFGVTFAQATLYGNVDQAWNNSTTKTGGVVSSDVAACDKQWLAQTLERLQHHGCTLQRLVPELQPLAAQQLPRLHLISHEGQTQALVTACLSHWTIAKANCV
jgi:hypothetical protein